MTESSRQERVETPSSHEEGTLQQYLAWVRRIPLLDREQAAAFSREIQQQEAAFREHLHAVPGAAALVLERWHERREAGRMTGLLAHGYHDDPQRDWNTHVDGHLRKAERRLREWSRSDDSEVRARAESAIARHLAGAHVLLETLLEIHDALCEAASDRRSAAGRARAAALGLDTRAARMHLQAAARARRARDEARRTFASHNLRLVVKLAKRYRGLGVSYLDLIQEGNKGLMRAVDKFDHSRGFTFSTYGVWWIEQALIRGVQSQSRTVRVPSHLHQELRQHRAVEEELRRTLQREPYLEEIAEQLGCTPEEVERIASCASPIRSLDEPVGEDTRTELADMLPAELPEEPCAEMDRGRIREVLLRGLRDLPERERMVLEWRFGLGEAEADDVGLTLKEIGQRIGLSRERVRQIQVQALALLRERADVGALAAQLDSFEACAA